MNDQAIIAQSRRTQRAQERAQIKAQREDRAFAKRCLKPVIYFLQSGVAGPIKIGYATNLSSRISGIQTGSHRTIHLLGSADGGKEVERAQENIDV